MDEDELEEIPAPATEDCLGLVSRIHHERDLIDPAKEPEATETSDPDKHEDEVDAAPVLPNKDDDLSAALEAAAQVPEPTKEKDAKDVFPRTLASALDQGVGGGDFTFWNSLWRFSVFYGASQKESIPASYETVVTAEGPAESWTGISTLDCATWC